MFNIFKRAKSAEERLGQLQDLYNSALDEIVQLRASLLDKADLEVKNQALLEELKHYKSVLERLRNGSNGD